VEIIFQKIDEIENIENIDEYLPKEYRITKEEYKNALSNDIFRVQIITKINVALSIIYNQIKPES
jgi:inorganic pyrophosphatase